MKNKKTQSAIEFLLILIFILIVITLIMYIIGIKSIDFQNEQNKKEIDGFAQMILNEIKIMQKMEPGFSRKFEIQKNYIKRFNLTFNANKSYFTLVDTQIYQNLSENINYYEFEDNLNITFLNESGNFSLVLNKNPIENNSNILII